MRIIVSGNKKKQKAGSGLLHRLHLDTAASLVEYSILVSLIVLVCMTGVAWVGDNLDATFLEVGNDLTGEMVFPCDPEHPEWPDC